MSDCEPCKLSEAEKASIQAEAEKVVTETPPQINSDPKIPEPVPDEAGEEYDEEDWVSAKKLSFQERKGLPDSAFCLVFEKKGKSGKMLKVRKFPAHDAAHVRNGLARLPNSDITPEQKKKVLACLRRRAKKFGIEVSEDKGMVLHSEGATKTASARSLLHASSDGLVWVIATRIGAHAYTSSGLLVTWTEMALASDFSSWIGKPVSVNHNDKVYGTIEKVEFRNPDIYMGLKIEDMNLLEKIKKYKEDVGISIEAMSQVDDDLNIVSFSGTGVTLVFYPEEPACPPEEGCKVIKATEKQGEQMTEENKEAAATPVNEPPKPETGVSTPPETPVEATTQPSTPEKDCRCKDVEQIEASSKAILEKLDSAEKELVELRAFKAKIEKESRQAVEARLLKLNVEPKNYEKIPTNILETMATDLEKAANQTPSDSGAQTGTTTPVSDETNKFDYEALKKKERQLLGYKN